MGRANTKRGAAKRGASTKDGPPSKLVRGDSENTKIRKAIIEVKKQSKDKTTYKLDSVLSSIGIGPGAVHNDFSCMLNQTNIGQNNNKYYVIQVANFRGQFCCFTRWGRVGEPGQNNLDWASDSEGAEKAFKKKFKDKTKNDWDNRDNFTPHPGKYTLLEMDEEDDENTVDEADGTGTTTVTKSITNLKCSLDKRTQLLIKLIFDADMFVKEMSAMQLDVRKMPLGKLSKQQIAKGLEVLLELDEAIKKNKPKQVLTELSSKFYTLIPHNFGRMVPPVICSSSVVQEKKDVMMTLSDIELTQSLQNEKKEEVKEIHPLDEKFQMLQAEIELIDKKSSDFKILKQFAVACKDTRKGELLDAWKINRKGESERFDLHKSLKNRKLLWHGTKVAVVAAILKAGLRIMPHSGGLVGRGIYFASEHAKSSWYTATYYGIFENEDNIGFMFLVEVALGKEYSVQECRSDLTAAPKGYDSVVARGRTEPDPKKNVVMKFDGKDVIVPVGTPVEQSQYKDSGFGKSEYLVYKESQARIRYLLKFSFK